MRNVKYGPCGHMFDPQLNRAVAQMYEQQGYDFMIWSDQMMLTIPQSIWTPDLVPIAEHWNIDTFMDTWPLMTDAAIHTDKIKIGTTVFDSLRRPPANMAQLSLTLDHYSQGRFFLAMGAGEIKQFTPYGIERTKPFGHLEESVKIIKLLMDEPGIVNYEGPHWKLKDAIMALQPYGEKRPPILIAGGPGRAVDIAAQHADGWITYVPTCGTPEWYAREVKVALEKCEAAGRNPDDMIFYLLTMNIIDQTEEQVEMHTNDPIARWDSAAVIPGPNVYEEWGYAPHPMGANYSYPNHLLPTSVSREEAMRVIEATPPDIVRRARACGTPKQVAEILQPYVEAVPQANEVWVNVINYTSFLGGGSFGDPETAVDLVLETCNHMRTMSGQPTIELSAANGAAQAPAPLPAS